MAEGGQGGHNILVRKSTGSPIITQNRKTAEGGQGGHKITNIDNKYDNFIDTPVKNKTAQGGQGGQGGWTIQGVHPQ